MAMPRVSTRQRDVVLARLAGDEELAEALGLVPYVGHETTGPTGRGKVREVLREPEFYDEADEAERLKLLGSSHAALPPLNDFNSGFNNALRSA
jgi:hypothetical protein